MIVIPPFTLLPETTQTTPPPVVTNGYKMGDCKQLSAHTKGILKKKCKNPVVLLPGDSTYFFFQGNGQPTMILGLSEGLQNLSLFSSHKEGMTVMSIQTSFKIILSISGDRLQRLMKKTTLKDRYVL